MLLMTILTGCAASTGNIPNFHTVDPGLYRGGQPNTAGFVQLKQLGVHTIIKLNTDYIDEERVTANQMNIKLVEIPLSGLLAPSEAQEFLVQKALTDPTLRPTYLHCEHGQDRTGLAFALFRVNEDGWTQEKAHQEMMDDGHSPLLFPMDDYFYDHTGGK